MDNKKEDRGKIRKALHDMLTHAEIDFDMLIAMRKARLEPELNTLLNGRYGRFYRMAEHAFFNSVIIILYKVFETRKDAVNFTTLKNNLHDKIDETVSKELEAKYEVIKDIWIKVGVIRNQVVGHQSLEYSNIESYKNADLEMDDIKGMIKLAQELLTFIASHFDDVHVAFNLKGAESFELLIEDLQNNNPISLANYLAKT